MMYKRIPVTGFQKLAYDAAPFDTLREFRIGKVIDNSESVIWWIRNDPAILRIPTSVTAFLPDFWFLRKDGPHETFWIVEVKGENFWDGPGSEARLKAEGAKRWVRAVNRSGVGQRWALFVILELDVDGIAGLEDIRRCAVYSEEP